MATAAPQLQEAFHEFGKIVTELLKLAALLVFGVLHGFVRGTSVGLGSGAARKCPELA